MLFRHIRDFCVLATITTFFAGSLLAEELPRGNHSVIDGPVCIQKTCYFSAYGPTSQSNLWRTDGTAAGTWTLTSFQSGQVGKIQVLDQKVYFSYTDSTGSTLHMTDGSVSAVNVQNESPFPAFPALPASPTPNAMAHTQTRTDCRAGKAS